MFVDGKKMLTCQEVNGLEQGSDATLIMILIP